MQPNAFTQIVFTALLVLSLYRPVQSQHKRQGFYSLQGVWGSVFAHTREVQNTAGSNPFGIQFEKGRRILQHPDWNACNCYPHTGIGLSFYDFDNKVLGQGATVYMFLEPTLNPFNRLQIALKGATGFSFLNNPFDSDKNPTNFSYSMPVSGYLLLGVNLSYPVAKKWTANFTAAYQHISNGGLREPNKGINWPSLQFGMRYLPEGWTMPERYHDTTRYRVLPLEIWLSGFSSSRTIDPLKNIRYVIAGLEASIWKRYGATGKIGLSLEGIQDYSIVPDLKSEGFDPSDYSSFRLGLSAGHAYLMGRFLFTQQIGFYIFKDLPYFRRIYQRWGLDYRLNSRWSAGVNLLSHLQVANFIDIHLRYRLF